MTKIILFKRAYNFVIVFFSKFQTIHFLGIVF